MKLPFSSFADELTKMAAEDAGPSPLTQKLKVLGKGMAGFGVGTLAGVGAAHLADKAHQHFTGAPISGTTLHRALPLVGAASHMAYTIYKAREAEEMANVDQGTHHPGQGAARPA